MSVRGVDMPILQGHSKKLPPLADEDTSDEAKAHKMVSKPKPVRCSMSPVDSESDETAKRMVQEVASVIFTARPCGWQSRSDEAANGYYCGPVPISINLSREVHCRLLSEVEDIWKTQCSVCVEVYGQAGGMETGGVACANPSPSAIVSSTLCTDPLSTGRSLSGAFLEQLSPRPSMLLEVWSIQVISTTRFANASPESPRIAVTPPTLTATPTSRGTPTCGATPISAPLLIQAVQSHLHFSQIRSWQEMEIHSHTHPPFQLVYQVRRDMDVTAISDGVALKLHTFPVTLLAGNIFLQVVVWSLPRLDSIPHQLHSQSTISSLLQQFPQSTVNSVPHQFHSKSTITSVSQQQFQGQSDQVLGHLKPSSESTPDTFPFSPPTPSPLSPKLLAGLTDKLDNSLPLTNVSTSSEVLDPLTHRGDVSPDIHCSKRDTWCKDISVVNHHKGIAASSLGAIRDMTDGLNSLQLDEETNETLTAAPFEPAPRAPGSPAPFSTAYSQSKSVKRRSCALTCKRQPNGTKRVQRCNSAPVNVSSLCLLGTFEESILNGRLEACGHVEGFMAELAASGSFCPPHQTLPVTAAFYNLHDNYRGTSPYLGQVDLSEVGKRGYQVPRKGTVQVTLFNPNHTVVKIYIVPYNFSDMPPCSQTFLRQKILSYPSPAWSAGSSTLSGHQEGRSTSVGFPSLHYLIHLRFLCSKSQRLYLHRDIRMLFARRAPDTEPGDSHVTLHTVTDGPEEPKYSPTTPT